MRRIRLVRYDLDVRAEGMLVSGLTGGVEKKKENHGTENVPERVEEQRVAGRTLNTA